MENFVLKCNSRAHADAIQKRLLEIGLIWVNGRNGFTSIDVDDFYIEKGYIHYNACIYDDDTILTLDDLYRDEIVSKIIKNTVTIDRGHAFFVLIEGGRKISFQGSDVADKFEDLYERLGYNVRRINSYQNTQE